MKAWKWLLILVVVVIVGWSVERLLEGTSAEGGVDSLPGSPPESPVSSAETPGDSPETPIPTSGAEDVITSVPFSEEREALGEARGIWVRVVDGEDRPVPGALVEASQPEDPGFFILGRREEKMRILQRVRTNTSGEARIIPRSARRLAVTARHRGLLGYLETMPGEVERGQTLTLALEAPREVLVEVVDQGGEPVAAALVETQPRSSVSAWTDEEGVARLLVAADAGALFRAESFLPVVRMAEKRIEGSSVPWSEKGPTRARVTVERRITLFVRVVDGSGRPAPGSYELAARVGGRDPSLNGLVGLSIARNELRRSFQGDSTVMTGFVPDGDYVLILREEGRASRRKEVHMPPGGESFDVIFERGEKLPSVTLRVLDAEGIPLASFPVRAKVRYDTGSSSAVSPPGSMFGAGGDWLLDPQAERRFETDADGRLVLSLRPDFPGWLALSPARAFPMLGRPGSDSSDRVLFSARPPGTRVDLGEVRLAGVKTLVAGKVVDEQGAPVEHALVRIVAPGSLFSGPKSRMDLDSLSLAILSVHSDAEGRFRIVSTTRKEGLRVAASLTGRFFSAETPFTCGRKDVVLRLTPGGSLAGRVSVAVRNFHGKVQLHLQPMNEVRKKVVSFFVSGSKVLMLPAGGEFRFRNLVPGSYRLRVTLDEVEVAKVDDVVVEAGEVTEDPRLRDLVVGRDLIMGEVTVFDDRGAPLPGARVVLLVPPEERKQAGEPARRRRTTNTEGKASFLIPAGVARAVRVRAKGFLEAWRDPSPLPLTITLTRGSRLDVSVDLEEPLPAARKGMAWSLELERLEDAVEGRRQAWAGPVDAMERPLRVSAPLDVAQLTATFPHVAPGAYRVFLSQHPAPSKDLDDSGREIIRIMLDQVSGVGIVQIGRIEVPAGVSRCERRLKVPAGRIKP